MNNTQNTNTNAKNRKSATGGIPVSIINGYALSDPVLFLHRNPDGTPKFHARVNVRINGGADESGKEFNSDVVLDYWNGRAIWACNNISQGSRINGEGQLESWLKPTGQVNPDGSPKYIMTNTINMRKSYFGGPTQKEIVKFCNAAMKVAKEQGLMHPNDSITGDFFVSFFKRSYQEFSWELVNSTGKLGNALVWDKARNGYIVPTGQPMQSGNAQTDASASAADMARRIAELEKELLAQKGQLTQEPAQEEHLAEPEIVDEGAAEAAGAAEIDPMP